jgi:hypothetical protein
MIDPNSLLLIDSITTTTTTFSSSMHADLMHKASFVAIRISRCLPSTRNFLSAEFLASAFYLLFTWVVSRPGGKRRRETEQEGMG